MRHATALIGILTAALFVSSLTSTGSALATTSFPNGPGPLLNCPDVDGDRHVTISDILGVAAKFGSKYPSPDYQYLYDAGDGDGYVAITDDILPTANRFGEQCSLIDQQVALASRAVAKYQNCQDALGDGYFQATQFVPSMGIHLQKTENMFLPLYSGDPADTNDQLRNPIGLICTDSQAGPGGGADAVDVAGRLIGMWFVIPVEEVCNFYGFAGECQDLGQQPIGFGETNSDEDNQWANGIQRTWHTHRGLCVWGLGTPNAGSAEGWTSQQCSGVSGIWFEEYGWMVHLYNFIPNQDGRFSMWSGYVPSEGQ